MRTKLTVRSIKEVDPGSRDIILWDTEIKGFGCKITPRGRRTFFFYYRTTSGQQRRPRIGDYGTLQPEAARKIAREWAAQVAQGGDPSFERATSRALPTLSELAARYLEEYAEIQKAESSVANDRRLLDKRVVPSLGSKKVDAITRADIDALHKKLRTTPFEANRTLSLLSKMFNLAEEWGLRPQSSNPARGVRKYKEAARGRYLDPEELRRLWLQLEEADKNSLVSSSAVRAIQLLILTGRRVGEILSLRWDQVDFDQQLVYFPKTKTGALLVPLSAFTKELLLRAQPAVDSQYVCPGRNPDKPLVNIQKPWQRVRQSTGLDDVRLHDLRHSYASLGAGLGMSLPLIGRLLGHSQITTTERYAHLAQDPIRHAAGQIEAELLRRISPDL